MKNYAKAFSAYEEAYNKAREQTPPHKIGVEALYSQSVCLYDLKELEPEPEEKERLKRERAATNQKLVDEFPNSDYAPVAYINLGVHYFSTDETDVSKKIELLRKALDMYQKAYSKKPEDAKSRIQRTLGNLIRLYIAKGDGFVFAGNEPEALKMYIEASTFYLQLLNLPPPFLGDDLSPGDANFLRGFLQEGEGSYIKKLETGVNNVKVIITDEVEESEIEQNMEEIKGRIR